MRFLLLAALFAAAPALAQAALGVRAGLNSASVYGFEPHTFTSGNWPASLLGLVGGVFADVPVTGVLSVRPELAYSQKGLRITSFERIGEGEQARSFYLSTTLRADYLEAPLLARVAVPVGPRLRVGVVAGPALAFKVRESVSAAQRIDGEGVIPPDVFPGRDGTDSFRTLDVGAVLGADIGTGPFSVEVRYTAGFLGVARESADGDLQTVRNGVVAVGTTYRLDL